MCRPILPEQLLAAAPRSATGAAAGKGFVRQTSQGSDAGSAATKNGPPTNRALAKTRLCKFFVNGKCRHGSNCTFAHGEAALQPQPDLTRTQLCFQYVRTGMCSYGERCTFAHSEGELRELPRASAPAETSNGKDGMQALQREVLRLRSEVAAAKGARPADVGCLWGASDEVAAAKGARPADVGCLWGASDVLMFAVVQAAPQQQAAPAAFGWADKGQFITEVDTWSDRELGDACAVGVLQPTPMPTNQSGSSDGHSWKGAGVTDADTWSDSDVGNGWTSSSLTGEQSEEELEAEVEAKVVIENTFINLQPVAPAVAPRRSSSAPPRGRHC